MCTDINQIINVITIRYANIELEYVAQVTNIRFGLLNTEHYNYHN